MPQTPDCPCGCLSTPSRTLHAKDQSSGEHFQYLTCPDCSLERLSPRPSPSEIGAYYETGYYAHTAIPPFGIADRLKRLIYHVFWSPPADRPSQVRRLHPILATLLWPIRHRSVLAFRPPAARSVFEFGAAKAVDLLAFRAAGWQVSGCEPSAEACAQAATLGIHLQQATAETAHLPDAAYGCILFNNVFEHIHSPQAVLRTCARALVPGGVLMLIVPNHASLTARLFGTAWPGYDAPRHTWGWSPRALARLLPQEGFTLEGIHHQATGLWMWRSTLDMRHATTSPSRLRLFLARHAPFVMLPLSLLGVLTGHGDWIRVVARRTAAA